MYFDSNTTINIKKRLHIKMFSSELDGSKVLRVTS